jgi:hypothetical protein
LGRLLASYTICIAAGETRAHPLSERLRWRFSIAKWRISEQAVMVGAPLMMPIFGNAALF